MDGTKLILHHKTEFLARMRFFFENLNVVLFILIIFVMKKLDFEQMENLQGGVDQVPVVSCILCAVCVVLYAVEGVLLGGVLEFGSCYDCFNGDGGDTGEDPGGQWGGGSTGGGGANGKW